MILIVTIINCFTSSTTTFPRGHAVEGFIITNKKKSITPLTKPLSSHHHYHQHQLHKRRNIISSSSPLSTSTPFPLFVTPKSTQLSLSSSSSSSEMNNNDDVKPGIGVEGCQLPSLSGINTQPELPTQALIVGSIFFTLGFGTYVCSSGLSAVTTTLGATFPNGYPVFRATWPISFGLIYSLAGLTHFTLSKEYENIYPPQGTWGIWYLPGSKEFHVGWTGIVELLGGLGLLVGGISSIAGISALEGFSLESNCATLLFLLTILITPANIYMYTHGALLPMNTPEPLPVAFHGVRLVMQIVLLGFLSQMMMTQ
mmetsp:Transcript_51187/g.57984  ORF Transcript_51187/g.57984 Transcript_51187/m.57984 type:complete len:313 (+) Transcript_51187:2-940(+)